ncbi:MAG: flippase-like domain-containing protein [Gemmatimonadetes bacterium]|nr:flippase-like domain-containing protein [Gemmatimonadota bacterium]
MVEAAEARGRLSGFGRLLAVFGAIVAIALLVRTAMGAWDELRVESTRLDWTTAVLATIWLAATFILPIALWRALLRVAGRHLTFGAALELWSFSNLGRYVPGKVWQVVAMVLVARDFGVSPAVAASVAFVALALQISTGFLVASPIAGIIGEHSGAFLAAAAASIVCIALLVLRPAIFLRILSRIPLGRRLEPSVLGSRRTALLFVVGFVAVWTTQGMGLAMLASALGPVSWPEVPRFVGAYALSYVVGLLAVIAPGGLGVREEVLAATLAQAGIQGIPLHVLAILARVWAILAEVVILLWALAVRAIRIRSERATAGR